MNQCKKIVLSMVAAAMLDTVAKAGPLMGMQLGTIGVDVETQKQQIRTLKAAGATMVRYPVYFSVDGSVNNWLGKVIECAKLCDEIGMTMVVTYHHPTPGKMGSFIDDEPDFQNRWKRFATGLKPYRNLWLNLANEPKSAYNGRSWPVVAKAAANVIRRVDPSRKIVVAAPGTTLATLARFTPPAINNMVIEVHAYDWYSQQIATFAPYPNNSTGWNLAGIRKKLDIAVDFRRKYNVPVYVGEVAVRSIDEYGKENPYAAAFLADFLRESRVRSFSTTVHAYREWMGWDLERNFSAWAVILRWLSNAP